MQSPYAPLISAIAQTGRATAEQLQAQLHRASQQQRNFPRQLLAQKLLSADELFALNRQLSPIPCADLRAFRPSAAVLSRIDGAVLQQYGMLPLFERGGRLYVATDDPYNQRALTAYQYAGHFSAVEPILVHAEQLQAVLAERGVARRDIDAILARVDDVVSTQNAAQTLTTTVTAEETPVVEYVAEILHDAIRIGASDIHFEPYENRYRVRFRQDGVLREVSSPPAHIAQRITSRLKVMAGMDIAEKRVPQDGRIQLPLGGARVMDFRVSTLPTQWGEKVALRLLDGDIDKLDIDQLGFNDAQKQRYLDALEKPQGLILVTGPTGSGKTTSLYAGLNLLNQIDVNVLTVEEPIEITLQGINQVNVNVKQGMTFATALRAFLRQDPDIIMVGEMRDVETATIAIKAAQTGHLVLSTLHTNDAPQVLTRLANMGIAPYNIAASVSLIMAQRLVRCLCPHCKTPDTRWAPEQLQALGFDAEEIDGLTLFAPTGCERCFGSGYQGRVGIYQVINITPTLSEMIMQGATTRAFAEQCRKEGFGDLRQSGLEKARQGITALDEVLRMTLDE